ncbi:MAG: hypothetical protein AB8E15_00385 [Bdellovibrionales bacterium]
MKKIIFLVLSTVSTGLFAQNQTEAARISENTAKVDGWENFDLEFLLATELTKNIVSKKLDGTFTKADTSLLHKLSPNDEIRYFLSTRFITESNQTNRFELFFGEFMYRRKNILTEKKNGIYLEAELKRYELIDQELKSDYLYNGAIIPQLIFQKKWGRKYSSQLKLRRHFYDKNSENSFALKAEDRVYLSFSNFLGRRWMMYNQLKYQHKIRTGEGPNYKFFALAKPKPNGRGLDLSNVPTAGIDEEILTLHSGLFYFFSRKALVEFYAETKLGTTYDQRSLAEIAEDEFVIGTALYYTAF